MKPTQDYFNEKTEKDNDYLFKKKYNSMVILGYVDKKTNTIKSVAPVPTMLSIIIFLLGLLFLLLPSLAIAAYYMIKASGRVREFRMNLESKVVK